MTEQAQEESIFYHDPFARRRKDMLPWWIKIGCWLFLVFGIARIISYPFTFLLNGNFVFFTLDPQYLLSLLGVASMIDTILKMIVAYALIKEKDWAIRLGLIQGSITLIISITDLISRSAGEALSIVVKTSGINVSFIIVIIYLVKLYRIKDEWEANIFARQAMLNTST